MNPTVDFQRGLVGEANSLTDSIFRYAYITHTHTTCIQESVGVRR